MGQLGPGCRLKGPCLLVTTGKVLFLGCGRDLLQGSSLINPVFRICQLFLFILFYFILEWRNISKFGVQTSLFCWCRFKAHKLGLRVRSGSVHWVCSFPWLWGILLADRDWPLCTEIMILLWLLVGWGDENTDTNLSSDPVSVWWTELFWEPMGIPMCGALIIASIYGLVAII